MLAQGTFDVKTLPFAADDAISGTAIRRYSLDKNFHGDLSGSSTGLMLGAGDPGKGTAGYVAMEYVTAVLQGRNGAFALLHFGTMDSSGFQLNIAIAPGSGTGELIGITGSMQIKNESGKHSYVLEYSLPA